MAESIQRGQKGLRDHAYFEAADVLAHAATLKPQDPSIWRDLGCAYLALEAGDRAIEAFERSIRLEPKSHTAYSNLGLAFQARKRYEEAEASFRKQIEIVPEDYFAHMRLGMLLVERRREREAIPEFEKASRIMPKGASPLIQEGAAWLELGDEKTAMERFRRAQILEPGPGSLNDSAFSLAKAGVALDTARGWAEQGIQATEALLAGAKATTSFWKRVDMTWHLATQWDTLGWILFRQGDLKGARPYLEASAHLSGDAEARDHLGQVLEALGDRAGSQARDVAVALGTPGMEPGFAEFDCLLSRDGRIVEAKLCSGLESLKPLEKPLLDVRFPFPLPMASDLRVPVRVRVEIARGDGSASLRFLDTAASKRYGGQVTTGSWAHPTPRQIPASLTKRWAEWAGADGIALGFTPDRIQTYLEARHAAIVEPVPPSVQAWLEALSEASNPSLAAWALARRLEAGEYLAFPAYGKRMHEHLYGISRSGSGQAESILRNPPRLGQTLAVDPGAPFWEAFFGTIEKENGQPLEIGIYAVWCYATGAGQRGMILDTAGKTTVRGTAENPVGDPWSDSRFWIITDWALAWGDDFDFTEIENRFPEGPCREEFAKIHSRVAALPGFWGIRRPPESKDPDTGVRGAGKGAGKKVVDMDFSEVMVQQWGPVRPYPGEAKARRLMSTVGLSLTVGPEGVPLGGKLLPGPWLAFFGPTAYEFGIGCRFEPTKINGVPQTVRFRLNMPFELKSP